jgi:hypothetical protein
VDADVTPPLDDAMRRALLDALGRAGVVGPPRPADASAGPWRLAGLREAIDDDAESGGYALSPRSTRGATRA